MEVEQEKCFEDNLEEMVKYGKLDDKGAKKDSSQHAQHTQNKDFENLKISVNFNSAGSKRSANANPPLPPVASVNASSDHKKAKITDTFGGQLTFGQQITKKNSNTPRSGGTHPRPTGYVPLQTPHTCNGPPPLDPLNKSDCQTLIDQIRSRKATPKSIQEIFFQILPKLKLLFTSKYSHLLPREFFKTSKASEATKNTILDVLLGEIPGGVISDQYGSGLLGEILDYLGDNQKKKVVEKVLPVMVVAAKSVYGNKFLRKLRVDRRRRNEISILGRKCRDSKIDPTPIPKNKTQNRHTPLRPPQNLNHKPLLRLPRHRNNHPNHRPHSKKPKCQKIH